MAGPIPWKDCLRMFVGGGVLLSVLVSLEFLVLESCSLSFSLPFPYINAVEQRKATVIHAAESRGTARLQNPTGKIRAEATLSHLFTRG